MGGYKRRPCNRAPNSGSGRYYSQSCNVADTQHGYLRSDETAFKVQAEARGPPPALLLWVAKRCFAGICEQIQAMSEEVTDAPALCLLLDLQVDVTLLMDECPEWGLRAMDSWCSFQNAFQQCVFRLWNVHRKIKASAAIGNGTPASAWPGELNEEDCRCLLAAVNVPRHAESVLGCGFAGSIFSMRDSLVVLRGCIVAAVEREAHAVLQRSFACACPCITYEMNPSSLKLVCTAEPGEAEPSLSKANAVCTTCSRKKWKEVEAERVYHSKRSVVVLFPLNPQKSQFVPLPMVLEGKAAETPDALTRGERVDLTVAILPSDKTRTDREGRMIGAVTMLLMTYRKSSRLDAFDNGSRAPPDEQSSCVSVARRMMLQPESVRFFCFPQRTPSRRTLRGLSSFPRSIRCSQEERVEWKYLCGTLAHAFGTRLDALEGFGFSLSLAISIASSRASGCRMSDGLSTLAAGTRWLENNSSKWIPYLSLPLNISCNDLNLSQGTTLSSGTNMTVPLVAKPRTGVLRPLHVLILTDDERGLRLKLESVLLKTTRFTFFDLAKHSNELLLEMQPGVALVNLTTTPARYQKRLSRLLGASAASSNSRISIWAYYASETLQPSTSTAQTWSRVDSRTLPSGLSRELARQFDMLLHSSMPVLQDHSVAPATGTLDDWADQILALSQVQDPQLRSSSSCPADLGAEPASSRALLQRFCTDPLVGITDAAEELFSAYISAAACTPGFTVCRATSAIVASAAVLSKILGRNHIEALDAALGILVCELTAGCGECLLTASHKRLQSSALRPFSAEDPDFFASRILTLLQGTDC